MKHNNNKMRIKTSLIIIIGILCLCIAIYSTYKLIVWKQDINRNNEIKAEIDGLVKKNTKGNLKNKYIVDFKSLKKINSNVVAWIKVNGTNIEYPIVRGNDNSYYLRHNLRKEKNIAGWIFADCKNRFNGKDRNIVIYGNSIKDGSMFGTLTTTLEKQWQKKIKNTIIVLVTEDKLTIYQVFSTYSSKPDQYSTKTDFNNGNEFSKFIDIIKQRSNYDYDVEVDTSDSILTLSSCVGDCKKRVVLHAKKIY